MEEALPCPFCGGLPRIINAEGCEIPFCKVICGKCSMIVYCRESTREKAVKIWNTRYLKDK